jgi:hypothetical protein
MRHLTQEAVEEVFNLDSRIARTVWLLVRKPGMLTRELLAGRRIRYVTPLRLYLTCSVLLFALMAVVPEAGDTFVKTTSEADAPGAPSNPENLAAADELRMAIHANLPRAAFVLMPVFGVLTWLFYRRRQPFYVLHLYHALHFHAFAFLMLAIAVAMTPAGRIGKGVGDLLVLTAVPYFYVSLRRVFGGSRLVTFVKGTAIGILYVALVAMTMLAMVMLLMRSLGFDMEARRIQGSVSPTLFSTSPPQPQPSVTPAPPRP